MKSAEERVAFLEGRVREHGHMVNGIREAIASLEARMDRRFSAIDDRFVAIDQRFASIDQRFNGVDRRLDGLDSKLTWIIGLFITTLVGVIASLVAAIVR